MIILRLRTERNENGTIEKKGYQNRMIMLKALVLERNGTIQKKVGTCTALNEPSMGLRHSLSLKA